VDGSPGSTPALRYAFDAASRLGAPLVTLHTWLDVPVDAPRGEPVWTVDWERVENDEHRLLAERLAGWQEEYPDVKVQRVVTRDRPVRSLLDAAEAAQLVVVGSRGRGGFTGMLLGSTSHALIHHCPCPLVVVRDA
jgi:nucleotide-binding universal stress UspA family protein